MVYDMYFVSKTLKNVFNSGHTSTNESTGYFFILLWFFPIGIWFIQARMNQFSRLESH